jgi:hypothetical protein
LNTQMNRLLKPTLRLALAALAVAGGCRPPEEPPPARTATQYVVAVDLSTSLTPTERASHTSLLHALVATLDFGDQLVLVKAHAAGVKNDTATPTIVTMPTPRGRNPLQRDKHALSLQRQTADLAVTSLFNQPTTNGSDLLATMHTASERARQNEGKRPVLLVLSDMLQCAGGVCMEQPGGMPESGWTVAQKQQGLVPSLDSVCVAVVGADASTAHGVKVREFWQSYFQAAGARFAPERYVHSASTPAVLRCS